MFEIEKILERIGDRTPYFLIRSELLDANIDGFRKALDLYWPNSLIAYSVKTNSLPWIVKYLYDRGVYAEVVSDEEYELSRLSGCLPERLIFNGPIKNIEKVKEVLASGGIVNIDSKREVDYLLKVTPNGKLGVRVNVDPAIFKMNDVGYQEDGFRFGFSNENGELGKLIDSLEAVYGHRCFGLHLHVNSITRAINVYRALSKYTAKVIIENRLTPAFIDIGGGFFGGVPGKTTPEEYMRVIREELQSCVDINRTRLIIEPGSAAVGSVVELYTKVMDVKDTGRAKIVTTDGSRIHIDPLWQKKAYKYTLLSKGENVSRQIICGYTCMDHDRLMILENEKELSKGDYIIYHRVGNYTVTFGGPFIRPYPDVYAEVENEIFHIRHKLNMSEYFKTVT